VEDINVSAPLAMAAVAASWIFRLVFIDSCSYVIESARSSHIALTHHESHLRRAGYLAKGSRGTDEMNNRGIPPKSMSVESDGRTFVRRVAGEVELRSDFARECSQSPQRALLQQLSGHD
jgi:hypothetical protein